MGFSLKIEAIAALLILLLLFYSYGGGPAEGKKQRWFRGCLHISLVSVPCLCGGFGPKMRCRWA